MKKITTLVFSLFCLFQLQAQDWEEVASLPAPFNETHHSYGFALDGMGYIVSGSTSSGSGQANFYQYNPAVGTWTALPDFPGAARSFAIGDTRDGKAYFGFGSDNFAGLNDLWVFDPTDMTWTELASCPCTARVHPALVAHNDKVFMGMGGTSQADLKDWWEYDIASNTWSQKPDLPSEPRHHPYQFGIGDYIYAGFGHGNGFISNEWFRYDPVAETWLQMETLPAEGRVAGTQFSFNDKGYVLSGHGDNHDYMETGEFWSYDPELNEWEALPAHPGQSRWAPASFLLNGEIYLINGLTNDTKNYKFTLEENVSTIDLLEDETNFLAFPNPFNTALNLQWSPAINAENAVVRVYDIQNRLVLQNAKLTESLDLSNVANGMLRVEVIDGEKHYFQMVVKH